MQNTFTYTVPVSTALCRLFVNKWNDFGQTKTALGWFQNFLDAPQEELTNNILALLVMLVSN
jgi:hypothetical protein